MADIKISALPPVSAAFLSDYFPVVQGGSTYRETLQQVMTVFEANILIADSNISGVISGTHGGTGVNNGASLITIGGNVTFSGAFTTIFTVGGNTTLALPPSGTLVTTTITNLPNLATIGTITTGVWNGSIIPGQYGGTGVANTGLTINLSGGSTGYVLSSDNIGNATWKSLATIGVSSVSGTAARITALPTTGNVVVDIAATYVGQTSITTLGAIATGTWQAAILSPTYGGTGVNNGAKTINLGSSSTGYILTSDASGNATWQPNAGAVSSVNGTINQISVSSTTGSVVASISASYAGQTSITTLGTISTGTWQGTIISPTYGGTGINNGTKTINLGSPTNGWILTSDASGNGTWKVNAALGGVTSGQGVTNRVLVNGTTGTPQTGALTFSLPQDIAPTSTVQFASMGIGTLIGSSNRLIEMQTNVTASSGIAIGYYQFGGTLTAVANNDSLEEYRISINTIAAASGLTGLIYKGISLLNSTVAKSGTGTIASAYGIYSDGFSNLATNQYAAYFSSPTSGTINQALFATNAAFGAGNDSVNPPTNGIVTKAFQLNTSPTAGYFLTSDASGNGTWQAPPTVVSSVLGKANQIAVSTVSGVATVSLTNGISIGSYQATTPPTGGIIAPGSIVIGNSSAVGLNAFTNTYLSVINTGASTGNTALSLETYTTSGTSSGGLYTIGAGGTSSSPLATSAGQQLGFISCGGYDNTPALALSKAVIFAYAYNAWTTTDTSSYWSFQNTPSGSITRQENMRLAQNGGLALGNAYVTTLPPASGMIVAGQSVFGGTSVSASAQVCINVGSTGPQNALFLNNTDTGTTSEPRILFAQGGSYYHGITAAGGSINKYMGFSINQSANSFGVRFAMWSNGGMSIGSYSSTVAPLGGFIVPGQVGIGTSAPATSSQVFISGVGGSSMGSVLTLNMSLAAVLAGSSQRGLNVINSYASTNTLTSVSGNIASNPSWGPAGAVTMAVAASIYATNTLVSPASGSSVITSLCGIYIDSFSSLPANMTVTTSYGLYVLNPAVGSTKICAYFGGPIQFGTNTTGSRSCNLGTNGPSSSTTPTTWATVITASGSTGYIPIFV